uniref:IS110 family transposase n=1 Tax=Lacinutrix jangbogonensis TaxID=1469557 RepID=UPI0029350BB9|nr:transposase [Lacinutrix jangbogonensis]
MFVFYSFIKSVLRTKYKEIFGVDISKDVLDGSKRGHDQFKNTKQGFKDFQASLTKNTIVVMEAAGHYHYRLAQFLYNEKVIVSVVNPLLVKRFFQIKLTKVKMDKSDAKLTKFNFIMH